MLFVLQLNIIDVNWVVGFKSFSVYVRVTWKILCFRFSNIYGGFVFITSFINCIYVALYVLHAIGS